MKEYQALTNRILHYACLCMYRHTSAKSECMAAEDIYREVMNDSDLAPRVRQHDCVRVIFQMPYTDTGTSTRKIYNYIEKVKHIEEKELCNSWPIDISEI